MPNSLVINPNKTEWDEESLLLTSVFSENFFLLVKEVISTAMETWKEGGMGKMKLN